MIDVQGEIYLWEDLRDKVSKVLGDVDASRSKTKDKWNDPTPEFDRVEWLMSDVFDYIEGRLQELDPTYSERMAWGTKAKAQASKALSYGVNFQAFKGLPYDETDRALSYLEEHGLLSMNYEATKKALREFRDYELRKELNLQ